MAAKNGSALVDGAERERATDDCSDAGSAREAAKSAKAMIRGAVVRMTAPDQTRFVLQLYSCLGFSSRLRARQIRTMAVKWRAKAGSGPGAAWLRRRDTARYRFPGLL